jgi:hypothetical protein
LISDPQAVPQCTDAQFPSCPAGSQLGVVRLELYTGGMDQYFGASVYNMVPPTGKVSDFAFNVTLPPLLNIRTDIVGGIRSTSDDGLYFTIAVPASAVPAEIVRSTLIFWGDPGDSAHIPDVGWSCNPLSLTNCMPPTSGTTALSGTPFLSLPSGCVPAGQVSTLTLSDASNDQAQASSKTPVPATGCNNVPFKPSLSVTQDTTQLDTPTGLHVDLKVDRSGDGNPSGLAASTLADAVVTLPQGMTLNPSSANGLTACPPGQFGHGSDAAPTCPASSAVGTVEIDTPLLPVDSPLIGTIYLGCDGSGATPCPAQNGLAYLYVYATAPTAGVTQKLVGVVTADPTTGQLTTMFANQPQVPFSDFKLSFKGGPTAPLANPLACGSSNVTSSLTPYSGNAAASPTAAITVDADGKGGACASPTPFAPQIAQAAATSQAGAFDSSQVITITRADGQQYLRSISVQLPPGLLGIIGSVPECTGAAAGRGGCAAASAIGNVIVLAGAGPQPVWETGTVYLTGPYNGAPFGLSIVVPGVAGPFNLGTVVVRAALSIDRNDAHATVMSDPLPQILGGIPLRYQAVAITINRSHFLFNPTSCAPLAVASTLGSATGTVASPTSPFQATGCNSLAFTPGLHVSLQGATQTNTGGHPTLDVTVSQPSGQANLSSASVTLPSSLAVDLAAAQGRICSTADSQADTCPANTIVGSATINTPLLAQPLTGPVYFVQGGGASPLPSLMVALRGQVAIDLRSETAINSSGRLVTTFPAIPDAPVSSFELTLAGGSQGILVVSGSRGLCTKAQTVDANFGGQNGKSEVVSVNAAAPCGKQARITRVTVHRHTLRVTVAVPAAGSLSAGGAGLRPVQQTVPGARTVTLTLSLTRTASKRLTKHGRLKVKATLHYTERGFATQTLQARARTIRR